MSGWLRKNIGELCDIGGGKVKTGPFGSQLHQSDYSEEGTPVVMPTDIHSGGISELKIARVSDNHVDRLIKHKLSKGDIVYGRRGDIGRQALITDSNAGWLCGTGCLRVTLGETEVLPDFLHLYLKMLEVIGWIQNQAVGATMPNLNTRILRRVPIFYPSCKIVQQKIVGLISAYDDLIENNKRRIALLEKMAEEIYREWFVRFRFPGYQTVEFEKGIPKGWGVFQIKDIVDRRKFGKIYREKDLSEEGSVIVIDQSKGDCLGFYDGKPEHQATTEQPMILFGDHSCKMLLMLRNFSLAENVIPFKPKGDVPVHFLFHLIKNRAKTTEYKRHWTDLTTQNVLIPNIRLQTQFSEHVVKLYEQVENLKAIVSNLIKSRDMLLPRLISGKLSVEDLDIQFPPSMQSGVEKI